MKKHLLLACLVVALCVALPAAAEEPYTFLKTGIQGGFNLLPIELDDLNTDWYSIGAQVHVFPWLSARVGFSLYGASQRQSDTVTSVAEYTSSDSIFVGGGGAVLFHLVRFDSGSFYLGPCVSSWTQTRHSYYSDGSKSQDTQYSDLRFGAVVGGQWLLGKGFALYGECEFDYSNYSYNTNSWSTTGTHTSDATYNNTRYFFRGAMMGFIAYLN